MSGYLPKSRTSLWLALRLPDLPVYALAIEPDDNQALVIIGKRRVIWANSAATGKGVVPGMDATTAQLLSDCILIERDPDREHQLLKALSADLYAFTPYMETYTSQQIPQSGLLLEISSCLMLFGGSRALVDRIINFFSAKKLSVAAGLAHSSQAAWLLSFVNFTVEGDESKALFVERLQKLPIQLLHDYPKEVEALEKTGFVTLGDLARQIEVQSISSIKKRFGQSFSQMLCDIFSIDQDFRQNAIFEKPAAIYKPDEIFTEEIQFEYPIHQLDQLQAPLEHLLQKLTAFLCKRQLQSHHIEWVLSDIYNNRNRLQVYADSAQSHWQLLFDLTLIQLENRDLPFEVDTLTLICRDTRPAQGATPLLDFDQRQKNSEQNFTMTAARLKARLGDSSVYKISYHDSYLPEESNQLVPLNQRCNQQLSDRHQTSPRPAWLFRSPIEIEMRKQGLYWRGHLTLLVGPERLQGNWWVLPSARDYFLAQRHDDVRLWVFRDLHKNSWFVQGVFG